MSTFYQLDFEKPIRELEQRIRAAEAPVGAAPTPEPPPGQGLASSADAGAAPAASQREVDALKAQRDELLASIYSGLSPWDTVRVARHPQRPQTRDYVEMICRDFVELHGDRRYGDDPAIVTGFGRIGPHKCLIVGHHKGRTTQEKLACHFGCAHPEGYRKALLKMQLAEKFGVPIVTLVDTPGAYPGIGAEQRGQAEAIAVNLREMSRLRAPVISIVIGEGGSGGALGIAVADRVGMLSNSWYSVISPEGCAAILWKQANEQTNSAAALALKLTAKDNLELGIIDAIVAEPVGGAHRNPRPTADAVSDWIVRQIDDLKGIDLDTLVQQRYERFRRMGRFSEAAPEPAIAE